MENEKQIAQLESEKRIYIPRAHKEERQLRKFDTDGVTEDGSA